MVIGGMILVGNIVPATIGDDGLPIPLDQIKVADAPSTVLASVVSGIGIAGLCYTCWDFHYDKLQDQKRKLDTKTQDNPVPFDVVFAVICLSVILFGGIMLGIHADNAPAKPMQVGLQVLMAFGGVGLLWVGGANLLHNRMKPPAPENPTNAQPYSVKLADDPKGRRLVAVEHLL